MQLMPLHDSGPRAVRSLARSSAVVALYSVLSFSTLATPAFATDVTGLPAPLQEKIDAAAEACAAFENGTFGLEWGAVERVDLDGDLNRDWVLNEWGFACSTAVSLYCGTGGCMSHFFVGDRVDSLLNQGWEVVQVGRQRVLVADVHGAQCGGINPTPCVTASVWDAEEGTWRSAGADWEE
jgi:hypothetical protein